MTVEALVAAVRRGDCRRVIDLYNDGINVNGMDHRGRRPLYYALQHSDAFQGSDLTMVKLLIRYGANLNGPLCLKGRTSIAVAVDQNCISAVTLLKEAGARLNVPDNTSEKYTPLLLACRKGTLDMAKHLIDLGADIRELTSSGKTAVHLAAQRDDIEEALHIIQWLVDEQGIDMLSRDSKEATPLHTACTAKLPHTVPGQDNLTMVRYLLERNPGLLEMKNDRGQTALHIALQYNNLLIAELLLEQGANSMAYDYSSMLPLHYICRSAMSSPVAARLISKAESLDTQDAFGNTALHYAILYGAYDIADLLIQHESSVDIRNNSGNLCLHFISGSMIVQKYLVDSIDKMTHEQQLASLWTPDEDLLEIIENLDDEIDCLAQSDTASILVTLIEKCECGAIAADSIGNLPFFLAASFKRVGETFWLVRAAAKQGLFSNSQHKKVALQSEETNE